MKTAEQIIDETIDHIKEHGQAKTIDTTAADEERKICCYFDVDTENMCAVGRCMTNPQEAENKAFGDIENFRFFYGNNNEFKLGDNNSFEPLDDVLKPQYRGQSYYFWKDLQYLHDTDLYWDENNELTEAGRDYVNKLKKEFVA